MISVDQFIGCAPFGPRDEALNHDHYLYGWPRESSRKAGGHKRTARAVQPRDRLHRQTRQLVASAQHARFVLTELVVSETVTRLRSRLDAGRAADVG